MIALSLSVQSDTFTVRLKEGVVSKSRADTLLTVICPETLMAKAVPVLPAVMAYVKASPSGSDAATLCTTVPFGEFSFRDTVAFKADGGLLLTP